MQNSFEKFSIFLILLTIENFRHSFQFFSTRKILLFLQCFFKVVWARGMVSVQVLNILYAVVGMLNFVPAKISTSFADHPSKILISKVDKFYTDFTMIIQKNKRVCTWSQNLIHFAIRCHREKYLNTSILTLWVPFNHRTHFPVGLKGLKIADSKKYVGRNFIAHY